MRHATASDSFRIHRATPRAMAGELTRRSAEGYVCTELRTCPLGVRATLMPAPADEPMRLFEAIPWTSFWQPEGWDHAYSIRTHGFISRPLPAGTVVETATYRDQDAATEQAWLTAHAARGLQLIAIREKTYYFAPADPAEVTYTVVAGDGSPHRTRPLVPPSTIPDTKGRYYIDRSEKGRTYYASMPAPLPPREGGRMDYRDYRLAQAACRSRHEGPVAILALVTACLLLVCCVIMSLLFPSEISIYLLGLCMSFGMGSGGLALLYTVRRERALLSRLKLIGEIPKTPPLRVRHLPKRSVLTAPDGDAATRLSGLLRLRLDYATIATVLGAFALAVFHVSLFDESLGLLSRLERLVTVVIFLIGAIVFLSRIRILSRDLRTLIHEIEKREEE